MLHSKAGTLVLTFCFDYGYRNSGAVLEDVVSLEVSAPAMAFASLDDAAGGDPELRDDLVVCPPSGGEGGEDVVATRVLLEGAWEGSHHHWARLPGVFLHCQRLSKFPQHDTSRALKLLPTLDTYFNDTIRSPKRIFGPFRI